MASYDLVERLIMDDESPFSEKHIRFMQQKTEMSTVQDLIECLTSMGLPSIKALAFDIYGVCIPADVEIVISPSPTFNAECLTFNGKVVIVLHSGFMYLLSFSREIDLIVSKIRLMGAPASLMAECASEIYHLSLMLTYKYFTEPFTLPQLSHYLSPEQQMQVYEGVLAQEVFIILHELSHNALEHTFSSQTVNILQELEADEMAFATVTKNRETMLCYVFVLYFRLGMMESGLKYAKENYPGMIERLNNLKKYTKGNKKLQEFSALIISKIEEDLDAARIHGDSRQGYENRLKSLNVEETIINLVSLIHNFIA